MEIWAASRPLVRAHSSAYGATELNQSRRSWSRFAPLIGGRGLVPTLYGAVDDVAAASETIFHTVAAGEREEVRPRRIALADYRAFIWSTLASSRDLVLISLIGSDLAALGVNRRDLILSPNTAYARTQQWALALWNWFPDADGLVWKSRQEPTRRALLLWEVRPGHSGIARNDLGVVEAPVPFLSPKGLDRLSASANALDIELIQP